MTKSLLHYSQWFRCYYANALKYCSSSSFKMYVESWDHSESDEDLVKLFWTSDQELVGCRHGTMRETPKTLF
jgi:hypothetical protein